MGLNFNDNNFAYNIFNKSLFQDDILKINDNILIPNFYLNYCNNILSKDMMQFELNHLIHKIFLSNNNLTFYETNSFQVNRNDIVFDCGGNMGLFAAAIANRCKKVYSFEPMSLIRKNLYKTANLYNNIFIIPYGLSDKNCEDFLLQKDNPGASSLLKYDNRHNKTLYKEKCQLITIDNFINITNIIPDFIKVDIEGSELELLQGAQYCLNKYYPKISIALHFSDEQIIGQIRLLLSNYYINIIDNNLHGKLLIGEKK